jgi:hypothetical protein
VLGAGATWWLRPSERSTASTLASLESTPLPSIEEATGAYSTNHGVLLLQISPSGHAYGVYQYDEGILVGHYRDGQLMGRWCEAPSRMSPKDAGNIEIRFALNTRNRLQLEGRWRYGDDPSSAWQYDFYGNTFHSQPPPELVKRLQQRIPCP